MKSSYDGTMIEFEAHTDWEGSFLEALAAAVLYGPEKGTKLRITGASDETAAMQFYVSLDQAVSKDASSS